MDSSRAIILPGTMTKLVFRCRYSFTLPVQNLQDIQRKKEASDGSTSSTQQTTTKPPIPSLSPRKHTHQAAPPLSAYTKTTNPHHPQLQRKYSTLNKSNPNLSQRNLQSTTQSRHTHTTNEPTTAGLWSILHRKTLHRLSDYNVPDIHTYRFRTTDKSQRAHSFVQESRRLDRFAPLICTCTCQARWVIYKRVSRCFDLYGLFAGQLDWKLELFVSVCLLATKSSRIEGGYS